MTIRPLPERRRVVVVDDQEDAREMLVLLLESRDHHVAGAADGPSALELIKPADLSRLEAILARKQEN